MRSACILAGKKPTTLEFLRKIVYAFRANIRVNFKIMENITYEIQETVIVNLASEKHTGEK